MDKLAAYRGKRDASRTPEPTGEEPPGTDEGEGRSFVVQEHHARRLHWDFRLEREGVLVSWALPKGVPDDPAVNHLAVHTEDHPLDYGSFQGTIPRGEYGAGAVTIWDHGTYDLVKWDEREVKIVLHGQRVQGGYVLFRTRGKDWMIHREKLSLPESVKPMLATPGMPPNIIKDWALEMKWDGVRALAFIEGGRTRLVSRTGKDITATYPDLAGIGAGLKQALLDGEIVAFGDDGWPSFEALQPRMHATPAQAARLAATTPVSYVAFDLLQCDGRPLLDRPYSARREELEKIEPNGQGLQVPPSFPGTDFEAVLATSLQHGLEGIVAKRLDSAYEAGARSPMWRKVKNLIRQEVVIGGWKPGKGNREGQIGSLLVGVHDSRGLAYAGHVGTGFTVKTLRMLGASLKPLRRSSSAFDEPVPAEHARSAVWVEPRLVAEVVFEGWTRAGRMRAPVYKGLRDDKDPAEVVRET